MGTAAIIALAALTVFGVISLLLVVALVGKLALRSITAPLERRIAAAYGPDEVLLSDLGANTFGVESRGVWQGRGNGALVLTAGGLHFFRFVSGGDLLVPLGAITDVSFTRSHLGKATIHDLLKVRFTADGGPDSVAWYVADPRAWKERIEELRAASGKPLPEGPRSG
jgi:hypothetical protein